MAKERPRRPHKWKRELRRVGYTFVHCMVFPAQTAFVDGGRAGSLFLHTQTMDATVTMMRTATTTDRTMATVVETVTDISAFCSDDLPSSEDRRLSGSSGHAPKHPPSMRRARRTSPSNGARSMPASLAATIASDAALMSPTARAE